MPGNWPVVGANKQVLLLETAAGLYPYSTLADAKRRLNLTRAEWRTVGDNQKVLYRRRLLARVGHAPANATDPHFTFNDFDWQNIFQLEAVVEFFMNFREPWDPNPANVPLDPATHPATPAIPDIGPRDFLDLSGTNATAVNNVVTLNDAGVPVDRIRFDAIRGDVIVLDTDTNRASRTYRITGRAGAALTLARCDVVNRVGFYRLGRGRRDRVLKPLHPSAQVARVSGRAHITSAFMKSVMLGKRAAGVHARAFERAASRRGSTPGIAARKEGVEAFETLWRTAKGVAPVRAGRPARHSKRMRAIEY
jgi:hypothetical protein